MVANDSIILLKLNNKHLRTLELIFSDPPRGTIKWNEIEALFKAMGGTIGERAGSRVAVALLGQRAIFHRPHPGNETDKGALKSVRRFLLKTGLLA